jgi:hypothetical protein
MVQINFALKEVNCKVVYYGPGLSGKTTNLEVVHSKAPTNNVGELTSIATEGDRTLFFDFLPLNLGAVAGMDTKFQIYTVPGQVYYNSTRKLVLQGADGIVFVADSRRGKMDENLESFSNLEDNLNEYGMDINSIPLVIQYNKRDLPDVYQIEELEEKLNKLQVPYVEAVAVTGEGVFPTLKKLSQLVLESLNRKQKSTVARPVRKTQAKAATHSKARVAAPVPVTAGTVPSPGVQRAGGRTAQSGGPARQGGQRPRESVKVVRDQVSSSAGVKQIERKAPRAQQVVRKRQRVASPAPKKASSSKTLGIVLAVVAVLLGGAALYFSGVLDAFLAK